MDAGRSVAWGEKCRKWARRCCTRQTVTDTLLYSHHVSSNLPQSSPVSQHCTLLESASWLCKPAEKVSYTITSVWRKLGTHAKDMLEPENVVLKNCKHHKTHFPLSGRRHTLWLLALCHGTQAWRVHGHLWNWKRDWHCCWKACSCKEFFASSREDRVLLPRYLAL